MEVKVRATAARKALVVIERCEAGEKWECTG